MADTTSAPDRGEPARVALLEGGPGRFRWDSQEAVRYEVALEAVYRAIGALSNALDARGDRDPVVRAQLDEQLAAAVRIGEDLNPADAAACTAAIAHYTELAAGVPRGR